MKILWMMLIQLSLVALVANVMSMKDGFSFNSWFIPLNLGCVFFGSYNLTKLYRQQ